MLRTDRAHALGLALSLAALCAPTTTGAQRAAEAKGKYKLVRVGDSPLPATITDSKGTWTVRDGWIEIYGNESWMFKVNATDPRGRSKPAADFGTVTRAGDALTFKSGIYGSHGGTLGAVALELSYNVVGDTTPERLIFARLGQEAAAIAAAPEPAQRPMPTQARPSDVTPAQPTRPVTIEPATPPPAAEPARPTESGPPPFDLAGAYSDPQAIQSRTLEIKSDGTWQMHWTRSTSAPGYGGVYFAADHGTLSRSGGGRLMLRSAEYGDFEALASGRGTIVVDYYLGPNLQQWRFVKNGVAENPRNAPGPRASGGLGADVKWNSVGAGAYHACALATSGRAYCWGLSASPEGSAGGGRPQAVPGGLTFATISVGSPVQCDPNRPEQSCENNRAYHVCALTAAGGAYCWGVNQFGQLGDGTTNSSATPVRVAGGLTFASISAGEAVTCAVTTAHALYCWGKNDHGELGIGSRDGDAHPTPKAVASKVRAVALGSGFACALQEDGTAYCWGNGNSDRLGTPEAIGYNDNPSPLRVASTNRYLAISAGRTHVCAVTQAGGADCWGDNYYWESGPGDADRHTTRTPTPVGRVSLATVTSGTGFHTCGLTAAGAAYCWGLNGGGRLGIGGTSPEPCGYEGREGCSRFPVAVAGGQAFRSLSAGLEFTCGVTTGGDAYCWGDNTRGQLGTGDRAPRVAPAKVVGP